MKNRIDYIDSLTDIIKILKQEAAEIIKYLEMSPEQRFYSSAKAPDCTNNVSDITRQIVMRLSKELILEIEKDDIAFLALELNSISALLTVFRKHLLGSRPNIKTTALFNELISALNELENTFLMLPNIKKSGIKIIEKCFALTENLNQKQNELLNYGVMPDSAQLSLMKIITSFKNITERIIYAVMRVA
ncbi:MAG: hypothetical protein GXY95_01060 [Clostridiales bacterium]|nr:hypothetical protein [Clostridiales bacterium]HOA34545.1 hypothetical protein [Clostridiales bacterium]HOJ36311.1 hypothetical protein [Clostridiales bacterium]HOL78506.1 hypothetical protein [Clostridiales bacterium]HPP67818.1 hypothetical protein [Clostridiales bacterium]